MNKIESLSLIELENIKGGTSETIITGIIISAIITFISGIIEGISNPRRCNE